MPDAEYLSTSAKIKIQEYTFSAKGREVVFDGYTKIYQTAKSDNDDILPPLQEGENLDLDRVNLDQKFTKPPSRYSEAALVKELEKKGIGRPSTYASIISVISNRGYADVVNKRFFPTDRGKLLSAFLEKLFSKYVDYGFTAGLEEQLDDITSGKEEWIKVLDNFWKDFNSNVSNVQIRLNF